MNSGKKSSRRELPVVLAAFAVLTFFVSGMFALQRGIFHDDILPLAVVSAHKGDLLGQLFGARVASPTRVFVATFQAVALWTGYPITFLNLLYPVVWFLTGLCAYYIILILFPGRREIAFIAGALTLTATGDASINTLHSIIDSVFFYFVALAFLLKWWKSGGWKWPVLMALFLSLSVWTYDASLAAIMMTPLMVWCINDFTFDNRLIRISALWYLMITPYLFALSRFLMNPRGYAGAAIVPMSFVAIMARTMKLFLGNFTPWAWASGAAHWFAPPAPTLSVNFRLVVSSIGTAVFLLAAVWIVRKSDRGGEPANGQKGLLSFGLICVLMALASNAIYAPIQFSKYYYRTQMVSRVWASMAIAVLAYEIGNSVVKRKYLVLVIPAVFSFLGIYGGLENQDYLRSYWSRHETELRSIVDQVPALKPEARLILFRRHNDLLLATEVQYLARCWLSFLYDDNSSSRRIFVWAAQDANGCVAEEQGFACLNEKKRTIMIPYDKVVLLAYSPEQNRYILQKTVPQDLSPQKNSHAYEYNPDALIARDIGTAYARSLLNVRSSLAR